MAITTTWTINNMEHINDDGGVIAVHWSCTARAETGESAVEADKLRCEPNPSSPDFVAYDQLTEATVLGWVYNSLIEGEETAEEAKARIEENRTGKVEGQIAKKNNQSTGMPWATIEERV
jgi:hypothetical protein